MILSVILLSCESLVLPKENAAKNDIYCFKIHLRFKLWCCKVEGFTQKSKQNYQVSFLLSIDDFLFKYIEPIKI